MKIGRRRFIKSLAGLVGLVLAGKFARPALAFTGIAPAREKATKAVVDGFDTVADSSKHFAMVIDVGACIGCRTCQWACKEENNIPDAIAPPWIEVFQMDQETTLTGHPSLEDLREGATTSYTKSPKEGKWYMPPHCHHCENPPCVKVCPVGATYKDSDGLVLMRYDRCIGCRLCVVACPYSVRRFNWFEPELDEEKINPLVPVRPMSVVEKCTFCVHRVRRGKLPRCVVVCPVQAKHFGDLNDHESEVSRLLRDNQSVRLLEELNTEPKLSLITRGKKWLR
jgi:molybdopterin-containing oxidoreductase family iron-sulfur binding subunit